MTDVADIRARLSRGPGIAKAVPSRRLLCMQRARSMYAVAVEASGGHQLADDTPKDERSPTLALRLGHFLHRVELQV